MLNKNENKLHQVGLNSEAYNILEAIKKQLMKKHKQTFSFSDAVIQLKDRSINNVRFTQGETAQIKIVLKGGNK